jgi:hypothetical protein
MPVAVLVINSMDMIVVETSESVLNTSTWSSTWHLTSLTIVVEHVAYRLLMATNSFVRLVGLI